MILDIVNTEIKFYGHYLTSDSIFFLIECMLKHTLFKHTLSRHVRSIFKIEHFTAKILN